MDFSDRIKAHAKRVMELRDHAATEEATKMALIVPFLRMLGYDPNDPRVVVPEYCADFGEKKACKVDYAIKRGADVVIIVEAKKVGEPLDGSKESQLQQYFQSLLSVKIAILTDGVQYRFYTDLEHINVMDKRPFMVLDFSAVDDALVPELKKLCDDCFDLDTALCAAQELKYLGLLKKVVAEEIITPSDDMVRLLARQVYDGMMTKNIIDTFRGRVQTAFEHHINDVINTRLKSAMQPSNYSSQTTPEEDEEETAAVVSEDDNRIVTTPEEMEGFHIVRAIMSQVTASERVVMRDTISYCGILLDDKNTKPICRLHFNAITVKYVETFDANKKGTKHKIDKISDIYKHTDTLRAMVAIYDGPKPAV